MYNNIVLLVKIRHLSWLSNSLFVRILIVIFIVFYSCSNSGPTKWVIVDTTFSHSFESLVLDVL